MDYVAFIWLSHLYLTHLCCSPNQSEEKYHDETNVSNTPERHEVLFQTNTWWYTVGLFLSTEQTFALASPSNNQIWKTNTLRSLSLFSMAYRVWVCVHRSRALLKQLEWIAHLAELTPSGFDLCPVRSRWCFPTAFTQMCLDADSGACPTLWRETAWVSYKDR